MVNQQFLNLEFGSPSSFKFSQQADPPATASGMPPLSAVPRIARLRLGPLVASLAASDKNEGRDEHAAMHRRTFFLTQFNIIKKESLQFYPLTGMTIPVYGWPLIHLPSAKLDGKNQNQSPQNSFLI